MSDIGVLRPAHDDEVVMWAEPGGPIMLKAIAGSDPVELNEDQAEAVAAALLSLVAQVKRDDGD
jgi:hypothetical protein